MTNSPPPLPIGTAVTIPSMKKGDIPLDGYVRGWLSMTGQLYIDRADWPWHVRHLWKPADVQPIQRTITRGLFGPPEPYEPDEEYPNDIPY